MNNMSDTGLKICGVDMTYLGGYTGLSNVSLEVEDDRVLGLIGKPYSGKSSLLRTVAGLERPVRGRIALDGIDLGDGERRRKNVVMTFGRESFRTGRSLLQEIAYPLTLRGIDAARAMEAAARECEAFGLDRAEREQTVKQADDIAIARAICARLFVREVRLRLIDDPFVRLNAESELELTELLRRRLQDCKGITIYAARYAMQCDWCDTLGVMDECRMVQQADDLAALRADPAHVASCEAADGERVVATLRRSESGWIAATVGEETERVIVVPAPIHTLYENKKIYLADYGGSLCADYYFDLASGYRIDGRQSNV